MFILFSSKIQSWLKFRRTWGLVLSVGCVEAAVINESCWCNHSWLSTAAAERQSTLRPRCVCDVMWILCSFLTFCQNCKPLNPRILIHFCTYLPVFLVTCHFVHFQLLEHLILMHDNISVKWIVSDKDHFWEAFYSLSCRLLKEKSQRVFGWHSSKTANTQRNCL